MRSSLDRSTFSAFFIMVFLAGFNAIGVRFIVMELQPFWAATIRFAPAALLLLLISLFLRLPLPKGVSLIGAIIYGALNFGGSYSFLYWGLQRVQAGMAQVILALVPLLTLLFAIAHRQEGFRLRSLIGAILAVCGISLVFVEQVRANVPFVYLLAIVLGAVCLAESSVIIKSFPMGNPIPTNFVSMASGALILYVVSIIFHETPAIPSQLTTWISLVYLILFGSCAVFILVLFILKRWTASAMSYSLVLTPFVTVVASAWLTQEKLSPALLAGAALVIAGVYIGAIRTAGASQVEEATISQIEEISE
jgi:drug/metabolite transporter (DMT)-like permease